MIEMQIRFVVMHYRKKKRLWIVPRSFLIGIELKGRKQLNKEN
jgi:hypothetical protein